MTLAQEQEMLARLLDDWARLTLIEKCIFGTLVIMSFGTGWILWDVLSRAFGGP